MKRVGDGIYKGEELELPDDTIDPIAQTASTGLMFVPEKVWTSIKS